MAPVPMVHPSGFLAIFAAVFGATATSTLSKLTLELLPPATLVVSALANTTSRLVLTAEVPHNNARPVLHVLGMMPNSKLLHQGENVDIIGEQVLVLLLAHFNWRRRVAVVIQEVEFAINLQPRDKMGGLEVCSKVAVFGDICQKLQGHQNILITRHGGQDSLGGRSIAITEV